MESGGSVPNRDLPCRVIFILAAGIELAHNWRQRCFGFAVEGIITKLSSSLRDIEKATNCFMFCDFSFPFIAHYTWRVSIFFCLFLFSCRLLKSSVSGTCVDDCEGTLGQSLQEESRA